MTVPTADNPPSPPSSASWWEDCIDIFYAPRSVFERRRAGGFFAPLLVLLVVVTALFYAGRPVLQPVRDADFARGSARVLAKNPALTPEQLQEGRVLGEKFQVVSVPFALLVTVFVTGLVLWIVGKFVDATESFSAAMMIATYASFPRVVEHAVNLVQGYLLSPERLTSASRLTLSLARFFDPDTTPLPMMVVLGRIDLITIWSMALLAIGLATVGKVSMARATIVAVVMWILGAVPGLMGVLKL